MSPVVFYYGVTAIASGLVCLALGAYIYFKSRSLLGGLYFFLTGALAWIGLFVALSTMAPNAELATLFGKFVFFGWFCVYPLYLHFALAFCNIRIGQAALLYIPSLLMFSLFIITPYYLSGYQPSYFGYIFIPGPRHINYTVFVLVYSIIGLYYIYNFSKNADEFYKRIQGRLILIGIIIPVLFGLTFDQLLPMMGMLVPPLAIQAMAVTVGLIGYALLRYSPTEGISRERITEAAADALYDGLFLTDNDGVINYVNAAGCRLTGYRADELLSKNIHAIFPARDEKVVAVRRKDGHFETVDLKSFSISGGRGLVFLARDLTQIVRSRKAVRRMTTEQNLLIKREQRVISFLSRFLEVISQAEAEQLWNEVRQEGPEIEATLQPVHEIVLRYTRTLKEAQDARDELAKKIDEVAWLNKLMSGREEHLQELKQEREGFQE